MKFQFSLQSVLDVELQLEQLIDMKLAAAKADLDAEKQKLADLKNQVKNCLEEVSVSAVGDLHSVQSWKSFSAFMENAIETQKWTLSECQKIFAEIVKEKIRRKQRVEGLQRLKENEQETFELESRRTEQKKLLDSLLHR